MKAWSRTLILAGGSSTPSFTGIGTRSKSFASSCFSYTCNKVSYPTFLAKQATNLLADLAKEIDVSLQLLCNNSGTIPESV